MGFPGLDYEDTWGPDGAADQAPRGAAGAGTAGGYCWPLATFGWSE